MWLPRLKNSTFEPQNRCGSFYIRIIRFYAVNASKVLESRMTNMKNDLKKVTSGHLLAYEVTGREFVQIYLNVQLHIFCKLFRVLALVK